RLVRDLEAFHALPPAPYDACEKTAGRVSSQLLVRYRGTDYSVPTAFGHREVLIRGYVHEVVISCGAEVIARHPRSYEREDFVFDPLHYRKRCAVSTVGGLDRSRRARRGYWRVLLARRRLTGCRRASAAR